MLTEYVEYIIVELRIRIKGKIYNGQHTMQYIKTQ